MYWMKGRAECSDSAAASNEVSFLNAEISARTVDAGYTNVNAAADASNVVTFDVSFTDLAQANSFLSLCQSRFSVGNCLRGAVSHNPATGVIL